MVKTRCLSLLCRREPVIHRSNSENTLLYWHVAWLQMDGLGDGVPPCRVFFGFHCAALSGVVSQTLLLFTPSFMFPSLAHSIPHWCFFYDLFLWSLCLCPSLSNLSVCCREGTAHWLWFILTPASVLWLAQSWHADTHTNTRTHKHMGTAFPVWSLLYWLVRCPRYQRGAKAGTKHTWAAMWLDTVDINSAFPQISVSLSVVLTIADGFAWISLWYDCLRGCMCV